MWITPHSQVSLKGKDLLAAKTKGRLAFLSLILGRGINYYIFAALVDDLTGIIQIPFGRCVRYKTGLYEKVALFSPGKRIPF
jgi:hypothetical protein